MFPVASQRFYLLESVFSRSGGGEDAAVGSCWFSLRAEDEAEEDDEAMMGGVVDVGEGLGNWGFKISRAVETGGFRRRGNRRVEGVKDQGGDELS